MVSQLTPTKLTPTKSSPNSAQPAPSASTPPPPTTTTCSRRCRACRGSCSRAAVAAKMAFCLAASAAAVARGRCATRAGAPLAARSARRCAPRGVRALVRLGLAPPAGLRHVVERDHGRVLLPAQEPGAQLARLAGLGDGHGPARPRGPARSAYAGRPAVPDALQANLGSANPSAGQSKL